MAPDSEDSASSGGEATGSLQNYLDATKRRQKGPDLLKFNTMHYPPEHQSKTFDEYLELFDNLSNPNQQWPA
jgi:hypothetical protein